ncbi:MAG TPA: 3-sulfinopropanoyl-CoA desulfinase, partial [Alphaproteobacteria bacterium]|nr:3-sulfinopropanoyl-CoA desulfinase [Alphaproteobacteria bacterium]
MDFSLTPAQRDLRERARALARGPVAARAAEVDRSEAYPWDTVKALTEAGFFGMTIPKAYGGQGLTYLDAVLVIDEMAQACGVTGRIVVEANMGAIGAIMAYGSEDQKKQAAALVLAGDKPAICITEPGAGSAASEMTTRADRRGNRYVVNGKKHWITGAGVSRLHLIFARVFDEQGAEQGIGGFIAVRDETPGLKIGRREPAMGLRGIPEAEVILEDMELPPSALVLPPRGLKHGFADLMNAYNGQRVGAATVALGIAQGAYQLALDYSQTREQFGRPIAEFQGLNWMLADMSVKLAAARLMIQRAAANAGAGFPDVLEAAQAKIFAADMAIEVTNNALQVFGAAGYSRNRPLERMVRDARMFTIGGGTAQILRTVVASR